MTPRPELVPLREGFTPRQWQLGAVRAVGTHARMGTRRMLVSAATGVGKGDVLAAMIVKTLWRELRAGFVVHRDFLLSDVYERARTIEPGMWAGLVQGKTNECDRHAVFASLQTVRTKERASQIGRLDWLFIDEVHTFMCASGFALLDALLEANPKLWIVGFTATPFRAAGGGKTSGLGAMFGPDVGGLDEPVFEYSIGDGIADGVLSPMEALRLPPLYARKAEDEDGRKIADILDTDAHNDAVVDAYLRHRAPGIAFCASVPHAIHLAERFRLRGVKAEAVWDSSSAKDPRTGKAIGRDPDRDRKIAAIQSGELDVVTNLDLLSTGFDCRRLEVMMSVRPTQSPGLFGQQVGRVTRLSPETGKQRGLVLDFVDNTIMHNLAFEADLSTPSVKVRTVDPGDIVRHRYAQSLTEGLVMQAEEDGRRALVEWRGAPADWHDADDLILIRKRKESEVVNIAPAIKGLQEFPVLLIRGDREAGWYAYTSSVGKTWTMRVAMPAGETRVQVRSSTGKDGFDVWAVLKTRDAEGRKVDAVTLLTTNAKSPEDAMKWGAGWVRGNDGRITRYVGAGPMTDGQRRFLGYHRKTAGIDNLTNAEAKAIGDTLSANRAIGDCLDPARVENRAKYRKPKEEPPTSPDLFSPERWSAK